MFTRRVGCPKLWASSASLRPTGFCQSSRQQIEPAVGWVTSLIRRLPAGSIRSRCGGGSGACGDRRKHVDWNGSGAEEVAEFVVASTKSVSGAWALESAHRSIAAFDTTMLLLQSVIQVAVGAMPDGLAQRRPDRTRIAIMPIGGDPIRREAGHGLGGLEQRLGRRHVAVLAEHHVDQRAAAVDGAI